MVLPFTPQGGKDVVCDKHVELLQKSWAASPVLVKMITSSLQQPVLESIRNKI